MRTAGEQRWVALAAEGFLAEAEKEARYRGLDFELAGDLLLFSGPFTPLAWARAHWRNVVELPIRSIGDAANQLRSLAPRWAFHSHAHHRRGTLVLEQLREWKVKEIEFPAEPAAVKGGVFTLLAPDRALAAVDFDRPDPLGRLLFREDKSAPSRAYLKLWEALTLLGAKPGPGERVVDLGASPGGWTWVLAHLGAEVLAIDRAPMDVAVAGMPGVAFRRGDAFQFLPGKEPTPDWVCSDVICYPEKLLALVQAWVAAGGVKRFVCTIKFQGESDPAVVEEFRRLGRVLHLHHNKHELTFLR